MEGSSLLKLTSQCGVNLAQTVVNLTWFDPQMVDLRWHQTNIVNSVILNIYFNIRVEKAALQIRQRTGLPLDHYLFVSFFPRNV